VLAAAAALGAALGAGAPAAAQPGAAPRPAAPAPAPRIIFDTDMGNDVDDALALAVLHAFESRGESRLVAVTVTKDEPHAAPYVDLVNTFYGRPDVPIGVARSGVTPGEDFQAAVARLRGPGGGPRYPHDLRDGRRAPAATAVLRRALAAQPDSSVVLVQVGFSTNLARLLDTPGDAHSPLGGRALVARKVRVLQVMAGYFGAPGRAPAPDFVEFNVEKDVAAARRLFDGWPTPVEVSGFEVGLAVLYPAESIERDYRYVTDHPVRDGYVRYRGARYPYDRPAWDLTSVLQAVRPDRGYFGRSAPGRVTVDARGRTAFRPEPGGPHRHLTVTPEQAVRAREAMVQLASQPPGRPPAAAP
jgi:inosine-uridine nucleoside N-ribohydrolase